MLLAKKCLVFYLVSTETSSSSSSQYMRNAKSTERHRRIYWVCSPQLVTGTDKYYSFFFVLTYLIFTF